MADFSNIIQEINTNLPDNTTQSITAAKLRTTLIDLTNEIDSQQDSFEGDIQNEFDTLQGQVEAALDGLIVDDLNSTSTIKALSANQGRILDDRLKDVEEQTFYWDEDVQNTSVFFSNGIKGAINATTNTWTVSSASSGYAKHYAIEVELGQMVEITANSNLGLRSAFFTSDYDNTTIPTNGDPLPLAGEETILVSAGQTQTFVVPENAAWFCINTGGTGQYVPSSVIIKTKTDSAIVFTESIVDNTDSYSEDYPLSANQGRILGEKLKDISISTEKFTDYTVGDGFVNGETGNTGGDSDTYKHAIIELEPDMFSLKFYGQTIGGSQSIGSAFYDKDGNFMIGYKFPTRTGSTNKITKITLNIPLGAKYFKTTIQTSLMVASEFYCYISSGHTITDKVYEGVSKYLTLSNTYIYDDGHTVTATKYVTTSPIYGGHGFYLELNEDYRIYKVSLFDMKGNILDPSYIPANLGGPTYGGSWNSRTWFSSMCILPQYYVKIVIKRSDGTNISLDEKIIKEFCYLDDPRLKKLTIDEPYYRAAKNRLSQVTNILLIPKSKIIASEVSSTTSIPSTTNDYFFYTDKPRSGVPYSEAIQYAKLVGLQVTPYTFLTAMNNRRSLMYTESLYNNQSEYGITYAGGTIHYYTSYFGIVCTGLTGFTLGLPTFYHTEFYTVSGTDEGIDGMSRITISSGSTAFDTAQLLDIIWYNGHCSIVSDIIYDELGNRKFVVWAESLRPTPFVTAYNKEQFNARFARHGCRLYRLDSSKIGLGSTTNSDYVQLNWSDYPNNIKYNDDICTFAGDKATFTVGDIIYLNLNKTPGYTNLEIYNADTSTLVQNINIASIEPDENGIIDFNLTTYNLPQGKYKARLTSTSLTSDYTYFEIIGITLNYSISGDTTTITFSATGGTPISVNCVSPGGYSHYVHILTDEEISSGSTTRTWDYTYNTSTKYIRLIVRGEYGNVAIKNAEIL